MKIDLWSLQYVVHEWEKLAECRIPTFVFNSDGCDASDASEKGMKVSIVI